MPRLNPELIGKQVIVTSRGVPGRIWGGKLIGLIDNSTLILEQTDGACVNLPQTCSVVEDTHPVVPVFERLGTQSAGRQESGRRLALAAQAVSHPSHPLITQPDPEMDRLAAELKDVLPELVGYWTGTFDEAV